MFPAKWQNYDALTTSTNGRNSLEMLLSEQLLIRPDYPPRNTPTCRELENLTARLVHRIGTHDWTHPDIFELMSEDYSAYLEYMDTPYLLGRDAYIAHYRAFAAANPDYSLSPISLVADVHENETTALVWMHLKVKGQPRDMQRESVTIGYWRRQEGKWQAYRQTGMRGAGGVL